MVTKEIGQKLEKSQQITPKNRVQSIYAEKSAEGFAIQYLLCMYFELPKGAPQNRTIFLGQLK